MWGGAARRSVDKSKSRHKAGGGGAGGGQEPAGGAFNSYILSGIGGQDGGGAPAPTAPAGRRVDNVRCLGYEKRYQPTKHYVFIFSVRWTDKSRYLVYRSYSQCFDLHMQLMDKFPEEAGLINAKDKSLPDFPGRRIFGRSEISKVASKRQELLSKYWKRLLGQPAAISGCALLKGWVAPRPDDINPPSHVGEKTKILSRLQRLLSDHGDKAAADGEDAVPVIDVSGPIQLDKYRAVATFTAKDKSQLSFKEGDIVEILEKKHTGWWFVQSQDQNVGWSPASFLEPLNGVAESEDSQPNFAGDMYITVEAHEAGAPDEISFDVGVVVSVLHRLLDGWWIIRYGDSFGYAPAVYLESYNNPELAHKLALARRLSVQSQFGFTRPPPRRESISHVNSIHAVGSRAQGRDLGHYRRMSQKHRPIKGRGGRSGGSRGQQQMLLMQQQGNTSIPVTAPAAPPAPADIPEEEDESVGPPPTFPPPPPPATSHTNTNHSTTNTNHLGIDAPGKSDDSIFLWEEEEPIVNPIPSYYSRSFIDAGDEDVSYRSFERFDGHFELVSDMEEDWSDGEGSGCDENGIATSIFTPPAGSRPVSALYEINHFRWEHEAGGAGLGELEREVCGRSSLYLGHVEQRSRGAVEGGARRRSLTAPRPRRAAPSRSLAGLVTWLGLTLGRRRSRRGVRQSAPISDGRDLPASSAAEAPVAPPEYRRRGSYWLGLPHAAITPPLLPAGPRLSAVARCCSPTVRRRFWGHYCFSAAPPPVAGLLLDGVGNGGDRRKICASNAQIHLMVPCGAEETSRRASDSSCIRTRL